MSSGVLARLNVVLALGGLFIASMLSLSRVTGIELPCGLGSGCDLVTQDPRSNLFHIPFAYYGLAGYTLIAAVALVRLFAPNFHPRLLHTTGYGLSLVGLFVSIGLTTFSIRSIHALCTWCLGSAVTMSLLFASHAIGAAKGVVPVRKTALDGFCVVVLLCAIVAGLGSAVDSLKAEARTTHVSREALRTLDEEDLLPNDAHVTGPRTSRATVVMFGDLTCPVCREAYQEITELMKRRHDFRYAFRQLPLYFHPLAHPAALISEMASERGRFWRYVDACYGSYPDTREDLIRMAGSTGLDVNEVRRRLKEDSTKDPAELALARDAEVTSKLGLHSTPSVFILIDGYYPEPITYRGIEAMLDNNKATRKPNG